MKTLIDQDSYTTGIAGIFSNYTKETEEKTDNEGIKYHFNKEGSEKYNGSAIVEDL